MLFLAPWWYSKCTSKCRSWHVILRAHKITYWVRQVIPPSSAVRRTDAIQWETKPGHFLHPFSLRWISQAHNPAARWHWDQEQHWSVEKVSVQSKDLSVQSKDSSALAQQRTWLFQQPFMDQLSMRLFYHFKSANIICRQYSVLAASSLNFLPVT